MKKTSIAVDIEGILDPDLMINCSDRPINKNLDPDATKISGFMVLMLVGNLEIGAR